MPKRALAERRPWLLVSLVAALAYLLLQDGRVPGLYLTALKGVPFAMLAVYAHLRHRSSDTRTLAWVIALAAAGSIAINLVPYLGLVFLLVSHSLALSLFLRHQPSSLSRMQKVDALAFIVLTPAIAWLLATRISAGLPIVVYGLALGAMAATAWVSLFPRYRVGLGALFEVLGVLLSIAALTYTGLLEWAELLAWSLFYLGHFLICTGVVQTLRGRNPITG